MRYFFLIVVMGMPFFPAQGWASTCEEDKRVVAPCYDVRGRLQVHANSRLYLETEGRLLGVALQSTASDAAYFLPENTMKMVSPKADVVGDFVVCPFTRYRAGKMQQVCIESAGSVMVEAVKK